jgi:hypothetical protein
MTFSFNSGSLLPFQVGAQLVLGEQNTTTRTEIDAAQRTVTRTHTQSVTVGTGGVSVVQLRVWPIRYTAPFSTTVVVDADVSQNDKGFKSLSDVIPDPSARTLKVNGIVQADDASEGEVIEMAAPYDSSRCRVDSYSYIAEHIQLPKKWKMTQDTSGGKR